MRTFNLRIAPNSTPKSIHCLDNKSDLVCTVWCDKTLSVNGQDLTNEEVDQLMTVGHNFWLFYNNLAQPKDNGLLHAAKNIILYLDSVMQKEEQKTVFQDTPTPHTYWCPAAMLVESKYIAALREEVGKLEVPV